MLYQKEIDDSVLIQFIILFTLNNADGPVPYDALLNLILDNCNINYNDFQIALANLVSTDHVHAYLEGPHMQKYEITQKGANAGDFFKTHIPVYIREPIQESIKEMFRAERLKNAIRSNIYPLNRNEYNAECSLYDDDNTELMKLSLYAGSREEAEKIAEYFRDNAYDVYDDIITAFSKPRKDEE